MDEKEKSVSVVVKVDLLRATAAAQKIGGRKPQQDTIKVKR